MEGWSGGRPAPGACQPWERASLSPLTTATQRKRESSGRQTEPPSPGGGSTQSLTQDRNRSKFTFTLKCQIIFSLTGSGGVPGKAVVYESVGLLLFKMFSLVQTKWRSSPDLLYSSCTVRKYLFDLRILKPERI